MSTQTPNLGLEKPAGGERPLVRDLNANMDKLDAAIGPNDTTEDGTLKEQIDTLGTLSNRLRMANEAKRLRVDEWSTGFQIGVFNSTAENSGYLVNFEFSTGTITGYTVTGGATTFAFSIHKDA